MPFGEWFKMISGHLDDADQQTSRIRIRIYSERKRERYKRVVVVVLLLVMVAAVVVEKMAKKKVMPE